MADGRGDDGRTLLDGLAARLVPAVDADLTSRSVRSGLWLGATTVGDRVLSVLSLFVLARLLGPAEFGIVGVALLVSSALQALSRLGLVDALVQRPEADVDGYLDTVFWISFVRGVAIAAVMYVSAPFVAAAFGQPVTDPMRALALAPLLTGLQSPGVAYLRKELAGHRRFVLVGSSALARDAVSVALAVATGSVWALVAGQVVASLVKTTVSYRLTAYRPSPAFDRAAARDLIGFGKWITAYAGVNYLVKEGDDLVVGWLLGAASLGIYRLTYRVGTLPTFEVTNVVGQATFPAYARLQDDPEAVRTAFLRTFRATAAVTLPVAVGVILIAPSFVPVVLGEAWLPAVPLLQVVGAYAAVAALVRTFAPVWTALGRPDHSVLTGVARLAVLAACIVPLTRTAGVVGAALAVAASFLVTELPLSTYLLRSAAGVPIRRLATEVSYPATACLGMGAVVLVVQAWIASPPVELAASVLAGAATYAALVYCLGWAGWEIRSTAAAMVRAVSAGPR